MVIFTIIIDFDMYIIDLKLFQILTLFAFYYL